MALGVDYLAALDLLGRVFENPTPQRRPLRCWWLVPRPRSAPTVCSLRVTAMSWRPMTRRSRRRWRALGLYGKIARVGWYHPDHLAFGFQQVSGPLFDVRSERGRLIRVTVTSTSVVI
jgi:hypothetical protein